MRACLTLLLPLLLCTACTRPDPETAMQIAALRAEVEQLKADRAAPAAAPAPELGQQMLELQIRHARLWQAGQSQDWLLTQFQLAELRESFSAVVELNGEHAALQPRRLADVLPAMTGPALKQMQAAGAQVKIVAPKVNVTLKGGKSVAADGQLGGTPSVLFDAVASVLDPAEALMLSKEAAAVDWFRDAFGHLKAIAACMGTQQILKAGGITPDAGVVDPKDVKRFIELAKTRQWARERKLRTLP